MTAANVNARPAVAPGIVAPNASNLVLLFALDSIPVSKQRLVCRWHLNADGRLVCAWGAKRILRSRILDPKEPVETVREPGRLQYRFRLTGCGKTGLQWAFGRIADVITRLDCSKT
jgi:hypothetical protein